MTQSLEDYLEAVSFLSDDGPVRLTDIASRLGVSKPSASAAIKVLEQDGCVIHEPYRGVSLTLDGQEKANRIRGKHRDLTAFLTNIVGVSAANAEQDACRMEHFLTVETLHKIREMMRTNAEP
jgi:DtxR family Mn-dependent transcriptional regulator